MRSAPTSRGTLDNAVPARVSPGLDLLPWLRGVVSLAFVLLLPMLIIGTSVRAVFSDRAFMLQGFRDNQVGISTGLDDPQLQRIADAFIAYFQAPPGQLQMQVTAFGQSRPLFNEREVAHMQDVQALVQFFFRMQIVAAAVVLVRIALTFGIDRSGVPIGREMLISVGLMLVAIAVVGAFAVANFDAFWTLFHQIAFRNGDWQFDPDRDYLIMLFPEPFWYSGTLRFVSLIAAQTLTVAIIGLALLFISPRVLSAPPPPA
ncbi:MAG: TIGR01906 family membrane protein [Chloroflexi bacterium]|nr:TIGR01906 family membrane protein [Chloroflexota bacterium]